MNLEADLLELWRRILNSPDITVDDDFVASGGDSLLAAELLVEAERLTGQTLSPAILFETGTVRGLMGRLGRPAGLEPEIAVRIGGNDGRLLHFFHGDYHSGGIYVKRMAELLGPDQPILAIAPPGIGDEPIPATIEQMASDRLSVVRQAQPHGPYLLGGNCNGALVAFEVARLLMAAGERVDLVAMIDPLIVGVRPSVRFLLRTLDRIQRGTGVAEDVRRKSQLRAWRMLRIADTWSAWSIRQRRRAARFWNMAWPAKRAAAGRRFRALRHSAPSSQPSNAPRAAAVARQRMTFRAYSHAMAAYRPAPLAVPVLYFSLAFDGRAWRRISSQTELFGFPDRHVFGKEISPDVMMLLRDRLDALKNSEIVRPASEIQHS
jgi:thioesterase domain-containing protein